MTIEITEITDLNDLEDAIESFVKEASQVSDRADGSTSVIWEGWDSSRKRPYILLTPISRPIPGGPDEVQETIQESGVTKIRTRYYHPFRWNIQITAFTDAYIEDSLDDTNRVVNRETADRFIQRIINRAYLPSIKSILSAVNIAFHPQNLVPSQNALANVDSDKYIHQSILNTLFSGIFITDSKDSDFFTAITLPSLYLEGYEQLLSSESDFILTTEAGSFILADYYGA